MNKYLALLLASLTLLRCELVLADEDVLDSPRITLVAAETLPVALKRFKRDQPKAAREAFDVFVHERDQVVEIAFVPKSAPAVEKCDEKDCTVTMNPNGSPGAAGVSYVIDKRTRKVKKTVWAR
ncbi:MAG TPA: hypothetical protein VGD41_00395 [Pyrinomonadaceae bacterium]